MNRRLALKALVAQGLAAALLAGGALAQEKPAPPDAAITARVERAIGKDPLLKKMDIKVRTRGGVVSLTGFVRSLEDIARAGEMARGVSGVSAVRNRLRVANRPSQA